MISALSSGAAMGGGGVSSALNSAAGGIISGTGGASCATVLFKNVPTNKAAGKSDSGYNLSSLTEHNRFDATLGRKGFFRLMRTRFNASSCFYFSLLSRSGRKLAKACGFCRYFIYHFFTAKKGPPRRAAPRIPEAETAYIMPPIPPIPPISGMAGAAAPAGAGFSATMASVVINRPATDAASRNAVVTTLAGSTIPAAMRSQ